MPFYEYRCEQCPRQVTHLVREPSDVPVRCDVCGSRRLEKLISVPNVRTSRPVDPDAIRRPPEWGRHPEQFGEAMRAFSDRTNVKLDSKAVDQAVERLEAAKRE